MRGLIVSLSLLAVLLSAGTAAAQQAPDQIVRSIYAEYEGQGLGVSPTDPDMRAMFSSRLQSMLDEEQKRIDEDGIGLLDFDVFVDGQDFDLSDLTVGTAQVSGDKAQLDVTFLNFGEPRDYRYYFVKESGQWRIDEIESVGVGVGWKLSGLLNGG